MPDYCTSLEMNLKLTKIEKIKTHLLLQFEGVCGDGSLGNEYADFIIESSKKEILKDKFTQSLILDFTNMRYQFGNRFSNIFNPNSYRNNKKLYIRVIPNKDDIDNWNSLINEYTAFSAIDIIQKSTNESIKSINNQMNR